MARDKNLGKIGRIVDGTIMWRSKTSSILDGNLIAASETTRQICSDVKEERQKLLKDEMNEGMKEVTGYSNRQLTGRLHNNIGE